MAFLKNRRLTIDGMASEHGQQQVVQGLSELPGVQNVRADYQEGIVEIEYDVRQVQLQAIEKRIQELGYSLKMNWWERLRLGIIHFTEENERDAAREKPAPCCSHPEEILNRAKRS